MLLWVVLAVMTGLAALALLWPLSRPGHGLSPQASDIAIYKDQLAEIDRDLDRGLIAGEEARAARIEVSRRLIEADTASQARKAKYNRQPLLRRLQLALAARKSRQGVTSSEAESLVFDAAQSEARAGQRSKRRERAASAIVVLAVPLLALGLYGVLGSPGDPDQPLVARLSEPMNDASLDNLVARVEAMLASNPSDGRGWEVLAPIYLKEGRVQDARQAYANALRLLGSTAPREANFGEAAVAAANGMVTADAKAAFQRAVALDPAEPRARYYLGLAKEQDGDGQGAVADWQAILDATPRPGPAAAAFLRKEIDRVSGQAGQAQAPGPTAGDVDAAAAMTAQQRGKMIQGMVSGLAARLRSQGGTVDEWMRLVKAYSVLNQPGDARAALADARKALVSSPDDVKQLDDLSKALGL